MENFESWKIFKKDLEKLEKEFDIDNIQTMNEIQKEKWDIIWEKLHNESRTEKKKNNK